MSLSGRSSSGGAPTAAVASRRADTSGAAGGGEMDALLLGRTRELSTTGSGISATTWRNWRGAGLSLVVIGALCGLIAAAILLLAPPNGGSSGHHASSRLTLDDLSSELSEPSIANGSWVSGSAFAFMSPDGSLNLIRVPDAKGTQILEATIIHRLGVKSWSLSPDLRHLLMQIWDGSHIIYDIQQDDHRENHRKMQWAEWGPAPTQMAFVRDFDLYYCPSVGSDTVRLTSSGSRMRRNARLSPFYTKQVFGQAGSDRSGRGLWWSPDGQRIAYVTLDESSVDELVIVRYTSPYPALHTVPYPKYGGQLPHVTLWVQLLKTSLTNLPPPVEVLPPAELRKERSFYLTGVTWTNSSRIAVTWSSSKLTVAFLSLCDVTNDLHRIPCTTLLRQATEPRCPFLGGLTPFGSSSSETLFYLSPTRGSCREVASISFSSNQQSLPNFLTKRNFQVERMEGHDFSRRVLFVRVRPANRRWQRLQMSLHYSGDPPRLNVTSCLLCGRPEMTCPVQEALFSPAGAQHFVLTCRGRSLWPAVSLWSSKSPERLTAIDHPEEGLREELDHKAKPRTVFANLNLSRGQVEIQVLLPPSPSSISRSNKYPLVLVFVPERESDQASPVDWPAYLSASRHYACAILEPEDARDIPLLLRELRVPGVDLGPRVGIWARGLAAYHALDNALQPSANGRKEIGRPECLVVLAPITDWDRADAVQAGRYLGSGQRSPRLEVKNLTSVESPPDQPQQIMIVHGTADEEVPVEHSLRLVHHLVEKAWLHRLLLYPDEGHQLPRAHLAAAGDAFLHRCLKADTLPQIIARGRA